MDHRYMFHRETVAITGAGGSIGLEMCRAVLRQQPLNLKLVSLTESGLYQAGRKLRAEFPGAPIEQILGSYGNYRMMRKVLAGVDTVIHAGAHKHVPICEENPLEAINNNVLGTNVLLQVASDECDRVCVISSDKAVRPTSVMGATKRVVENLAVHFSNQRARIVIVRFGNVMDSAGSVLPLWREQIAAGGPLTLTDERCERYLMSIPDAVGLILQAVAQGATGRVYVLNMGERVKMVELARRMIADSGKRIEIEVTGLRPGEKILEELHHGGRLVAVNDRISMLTDAQWQMDPRELDDLWLAYRVGNEQQAVKILWKMAQ